MTYYYLMLRTSFGTTFGEWGVVSQQYPSGTVTLMYGRPASEAQKFPTMDEVCDALVRYGAACSEGKCIPFRVRIMRVEETQPAPVRTETVVA